MVMKQSFTKTDTAVIYKAMTDKSVIISSLKKMKNGCVSFLLIRDK